VALLVHADAPAPSFAQQLANNVHTRRSAADVLALMSATGGAGPEQECVLALHSYWLMTR
jgi:hypothetical protein